MTAEQAPEAELLPAEYATLLGLTALSVQDYYK